MILAIDDEVIPYQQSLDLYGNDCKVVLTVGGHRLESLVSVLDEINQFIYC